MNIQLWGKITRQILQTIVIPSLWLWEIYLWSHYAKMYIRTNFVSSMLHDICFISPFSLAPYRFAPYSASHLYVYFKKYIYILITFFVPRIIISASGSTIIKQNKTEPSWSSTSKHTFKHKLNINNYQNWFKYLERREQYEGVSTIRIVYRSETH